nr:anther-specific proline-rich protein APG-like [Aegilops tauschii subsp. strangulata]
MPSPWPSSPRRPACLRLFLDGPALRPCLLPLKTRAGVCFAAPPRRPSALLRLIPDAGREPAPSPCLLVRRVEAPSSALSFAPDPAPPSDSVAPVPFRPVPAEAASPEPLHRVAAPLLYLLLLPLFFSNEQQLAHLVSPLTTPGQRASRSGPGPAPAPRPSAPSSLPLHRLGLSPCFGFVPEL